MPIPLAPVAGLALRYGAVALAAYAATRVVELGRHSQPVEDEFDTMPEGVSLRRDAGQMNGAGRIRRTVRVGRHGPGVEIDASLLGRIRVRRA